MQKRRLRNRRLEKERVARVEALHIYGENPEFSMEARDENGETYTHKFSFNNTLGLDPIHLDPRVMETLKYTVGDLSNITAGSEATWDFPTFFGEQSPPTHGVDSGEGLTTEMNFPQEFADRDNHSMKSVMHAASKFTLKPTAFDFYAGEEVAPQREAKWHTRHIRFIPAIMKEGSMRQAYSLIRYYTSTEGDEIHMTGKGMAIPFAQLLDQGLTGKYTINQFIMQGVETIALGFRDFYHVLLFERMFDMPDFFVDKAKHEGQRFASYEAAHEFTDGLFGILNEQAGKVHPMDELIRRVRTQIRTYNPKYGEARLLGVTLNDDVLIGEKYQTWNSVNSYIDFSKKGGLRNVEHLGDLDAYLYQAAPGVTVSIMGITKFYSEKNPNGLMPLDRQIEMAYWVLFPSCFDVYDAKKPGAYEIDHHSVLALDTTYTRDMPGSGITPQSYKKMDFSELMHYYGRDTRSTTAFRKTFTSRQTGGAAGRTFGGAVKASCANAPALGDKYWDALYKIVVGKLWRGTLPLETVRNNIRFAIMNNTHAYKGTNTTGKPSIATLPGAAEYDAFIGRVFAMFGADGFNQPVDKAVVAVLFLNQGEALQLKNKKLDTRPGDRSTFINSLLSGTTTAVKYSKFILSSLRGLKVGTEFEYTKFSDLIVKKIKAHRILNFGVLWDLMEKYSLPPFWKTVWFRSDRLRAESALFGTKDMAKRLHIRPTAMVKMNPTTFYTTVEFKDNPGIRFNRLYDAYVAYDVKVNLPPTVPTTCNIPMGGRARDRLRVVLFPLADDLESTTRLGLEDIETLADIMEPRAMEQMRAQSKFQALSDYLLVSHMRRHGRRPMHDYFLKEGYVYPAAIAHKGGYYLYNKDTAKWDIKEHVAGPMGKLYNN